MIETLLQKLNKIFEDSVDKIEKSLFDIDFAEEDIEKMKTCCGHPNQASCSKSKTDKQALV